LTALKDLLWFQDRTFSHNHCALVYYSWFTMRLLRDTQA
jgi:hypothetical protein